MEPTNTSAQAPEGDSTKRRFYAYTSNGDWMEMTPPDDGGTDPWGPPSVFFLTVEAEDDDHFWELADRRDGTVLAQVLLKEGRFCVDLADDKGP